MLHIIHSHRFHFIAGVILSLGCLFLLVPSTAFADCSVYIAGNPAMAPFEFYDPQSHTYRGILPDLYQQISEETNISFQYVSPGIIDQQQRLVRNRQVELVSAHEPNEEFQLNEQMNLYSYTKDGELHTVAISFTDSIPAEAATYIRQKISMLTADDMLDSILVHYTERPRISYALNLAFWFGGLAGCLVMILLLIYLRKKNRRQTALLLQTDPLTELHNLVGLEDVINKKLSNDTKYFCYVACISAGPHTYQGNDVTDTLQKQIANTLSSHIVDNEFIAHLNDDTFAIAFCTPHEQAALRHMNELIHTLNVGFSSYGLSFHSGICPLHLADLQIKKATNYAQHALLKAKSEHIDTFLVTTHFIRMNEYHLRLRSTLSTALQNDEFVIYLQFILDTQTKKICGAEIFPRWQNPREGILKQEDFISDIQAANLLDQLDFQVLEKTCSLLEYLSENFTASFWLSCNFSYDTISRADFWERFLAIVTPFNFDHQQLVLVVSADSLKQDNALVAKNIADCQQAGFRIAFDDWGSGYASLSDLCSYQLDIMKIDQGFFAKSVDQKRNILLKGLVELAHKMDYQILCEGIHNEEEQRCASLAGCDFVQSFLYSQALPVDVALEELEKSFSLS